MSKVWWFVLSCYSVWSGSILQIRTDIIKVGSKSWLLTCSSNITLSLPSYTALKRELKFCNGYLSLLYFCPRMTICVVNQLKTIAVGSYCSIIYYKQKMNNWTLPYSHKMFFNNNTNKSTYKFYFFLKIFLFSLPDSIGMLKDSFC